MLSSSWGNTPRRPTVSCAAAALRADWRTVSYAAAALRANWPTLRALLGALVMAGSVCACSKSSSHAGAAGSPSYDAAVPVVDAGGTIGNSPDGGVGPTVTPQGETYYWLENTSIKVQPTTASGPAGGSITIEGAGNSVEAYQIVIHPAGAALAGIDGTASALTDGAGDTIAADNLTLFRQDFIDFTGVNVMGGSLPAPSKSPTQDGRVPDALVPFKDPYAGSALGAPFDVAADTNQPLWLDVKIPSKQAPGTYTGSVTLKSGTTTIRVPISLKVWDLSLPDLSAVPAWFKLDYNYIEQYHAGVHDCFYSHCADDSPARKIITHYQELLHEHRIDPKQVLISEPGSCGTPDFTQMDSQLAPYMDGSYWADGVPSSLFGAPFGPGDSSSTPQSCGHDAFVSLARAWATHLKQKGWFNRTYVYAEDEPPESDLPVIAQHAGWMDEADPDWKAHIFDTTAATATSAPLLDPVMGIYVLCLKCYDNWYYTDGHIYGRKEWADRLTKGIRFWFYESNAQGPPYLTFASNTLDAGEPRMMMWGSWYEGATGFLYWAVDNWDDKNPWGPTVGFGKTGDGVLIYPGDHTGTNAPLGSPASISIAGPIPTIRLKMVRSGLQDWALFQMADQRGLRSAALAEVSKVYGQLGGCDWQGCPAPVNGQWYWKTDYDLMSQARRNIVALLFK